MTLKREPKIQNLYSPFVLFVFYARKRRRFAAPRGGNEPWEFLPATARPPPIFGEPPAYQIFA